MATRKRWATALGNPAVPAEFTQHRSKVATYRHVSETATRWWANELPSPWMNVYLDEGAGWGLYERVDLSLLVPGGAS